MLVLNPWEIPRPCWGGPAPHSAVWNLFCTSAFTEKGAPGSLKVFVLWQQMPVLLIARFLGNSEERVEIYPGGPCTVLEVPLEGSRCFGNAAERWGRFPSLLLLRSDAWKMPSAGTTATPATAAGSRASTSAPRCLISNFRNPS